MKGQVVSDGIGGDDGGQRHQASNDQRAQCHRPVERIGGHGEEVFAGQPDAEQRAVIAAESEKQHEAKREQDQQEGDQRAGQQHGSPETR